MGWKTWRRPTLPCLETQYHGRWGFSRPSSGWDRVQAPRQSHQVVQSIRDQVSSGATVLAMWVAVLVVCVRADRLGMTAGTGDDFHAWC